MHWIHETHNDRGYGRLRQRQDHGRFWERRSQEWETELQAVDAERARVEAPKPCAMATAQWILELAKQAEFLYKTQNPAEQRRLLR